MIRTKHRAVLVSMVFALALVASACGGDDDGGGDTGGTTASTGATASGTTITAVEKDFEITLDSSSVAAGDVTFDVTNDGPSVHEFVVFQTDFAEDAIPTADGLIDEATDGITVVDEIEDIAAGSAPTLSVSLDPGSYVIVCNIVGHYESGMHVALTVT